MATISELAYKWLRKQGYIVDGVERILQSNIRKDCFGFADKLAIGLDGVWLVQETSGSNRWSRRKKIEQSAYARQILAWGTCGICLLSFRKVKARGQRVAKWVTTAEIWTIDGWITVTALPADFSASDV